MKSVYLMRYNVLVCKMMNVMFFVVDYLGEDIKNVMYQMGIVIFGYIKVFLDDFNGGCVFVEFVKFKVFFVEEMIMYCFFGEGFNFLFVGIEIIVVSLCFLVFICFVC